MIKFVTIDSLGEDATDFLYMLMAERMTEPHVNISAKKMPSYREHQRFVASRPYRLWFIVVRESDGAWLGYVSATQRNEIGIVLLKAFRKQGYGHAALQKLMAEHNPLEAVPSERVGNWLANINPENEASIKLFAKLGFKLKSHTYEAEVL